MQYRRFIEENFLIDEPKSGMLVPFKFRDVQNKYYDELVRDYDIEGKGLMTPIREIILKARKEGFTSLILAIFAVDDILSENPTETLVFSYKDDGTSAFRKRYRNFLLSFAAKDMGYTLEDIRKQPMILDKVAKTFLSVDSTEFELAHNKAHFYCGTASARVGGRGGTVQKILYSEAAFYPDKKELRAKEIIEGTANQMDKESGWIFMESTANGDLNHYAKTWQLAEAGQSRYKPRFYGWRDFYTEEQFELIKLEFTDKRMIPQEYPENPREAFLSSGERFFDPTVSSSLRIETPIVVGNWNYYGDFVLGHRYILGADVSEGVRRHNSTIAVIDMDYVFNVGGLKINKPKVVAVYASNEIAPDLFAFEIKSGATRFGNCLAVVERNNHGFTTLSKLKEIYYNIHEDENGKLGFQTNSASKPKMMHDIRTAVHEGSIEVVDASLRQEIIGYPATDLNLSSIDEEDETLGHYDRLIALAIAWQIRSRAIPGYVGDVVDNEQGKFSNFDRFVSLNEL